MGFTKDSRGQMPLSVTIRLGLHQRMQLGAWKRLLDIYFSIEWYFLTVPKTSFAKQAAFLKSKSMCVRFYVV